MTYDEATFRSYLEGVPMFQACNDDEMEALTFLAAPKSVDAGADIVREGDEGDAFYVVMSGTATVVRGSETVATLEPGDYFGELALFDPAPRNATVKADGAVMLAEMERDRFRAALEAVPAMRDTLLRGMARRLHDLDGRT